MSERQKISKAQGWFLKSKRIVEPLESLLKKRKEKNTIRNEKAGINTDAAKMKSNRALSGYVSHGQII